MINDHARIAKWQNDLVPHIVDRLARESPDASYGVWPIVPASYEAGLRTVTYKQLANVVNGLAWWLTEQLGPGQNHEVLTYIGPNDVRVSALALGAIKAGYALFLTSPRNSPAAHRKLFDSLKCQVLITPDPTPPPALPAIEAVKPRVLAVPSVEELLEKSYAHFPFEKTFEEARWDPFLIIHTSGSTGLPKPLIWTHSTAIRHYNFTSRDPPEGVVSLERLYYGKRVIATLPPFHGAGLGQYFFNAIPFGIVAIAPAAAGIVTGQGFVDALKQTPADVAILVPSVVAELGQDPELLDYCAKHLELIIYIGGDLPQALGDRVAAKVKLRCQWGASEVGIPQQLMPAELGPSDWHYTRFHSCTGAVFDQVADNTYELVIRRDKALAETQPCFSIRGLDQLEKEYRTRDLFERHPTLPDLWRWRARADDIVVFLNGEKTNPVSMEQHVVDSNPELSGALVLGSQRFQAALLIEPAVQTTPLSTAEQAALIEQIWPSVEEANRVAPAHARVEKTLILVTEAGRPLIRAGKGTIQRAASLVQYAAEIDKLYADVDLTLEDDDTDAPLNAESHDAVKSLIRDTISKAIGWSDIDDSTDFLSHGMDSLQALRLTRGLRRALRRPNVALSTVYQNPTISRLTSALLEESSKVADHGLMESLLSTYCGLIREIPVPTPPEPNKEEKTDVILTGSTGTLGTYLLSSLLNRPGIGHIFCLNRSQGGGRHVQSFRFAATGLPTDGLKDRVSFFQADLAHPKLGLDEETYQTLRARVGLVIHNAWPVNFNLGLEAFRPQLAGLVNLFNLSAVASPRTMHVVFVSSVGAVGGWPVNAGPAPEAVLESRDPTLANGYSRSKFLSEILCETAAQHLGIPVAVARVGQVAGAARKPGVWNRSEWLPSLIISSLNLGFLPDNLGPQFSEVDWLPSDLLADIIVDVADYLGSKALDTSSASVFNLRNPKTIAWETLIPAVTEAAQENLKKSLEIVPPSTWLAHLQKATADTEKGGKDNMAKIAASNPAIKLLEFYTDGLWAEDAVTAKPMAVERASAASSTLRDMPPVGVQWMRKWVNEWISAQELLS
ncbi:putative NRPS-like enzyme [Hypoxylon trugodes]|uniref:putative NRPS-like enzyme n=1 Tax=Hypoxylon trugodes TaxID=326681 RepID=UPI00219FDED5|nr:putative NRPS-like enzyme [Hypoxylon trugodes]KAI1392428.1 putative NRPS-like enzyme [Hypoxylon trugodes]